MKKLIALFISLVLVISLCACSSKSAGSSYNKGYAPETAYDDALDIGFTADSSENTSMGSDGKYTDSASKENLGYKIIKNARLRLISRNFDEDIASIEKLLNEYEGYVSSSEIQGTKPEAYGDYGRTASLVVRIKQENLDAFLQSTGNLCEVTYKNISTDDVTTQYFDTQSRLKVYQTQYDRIIELIAKAENIEDLITLEAELTRITYEIESLTTDIKRWDNLISYSTVTINITEKNTLSNISSNNSFFGKIAEGFLSTLSSVGVFFAELFAGIIIYSPVLIIFAVVLVVIIVILKKKNIKIFRRKAIKNKALENKENEEKSS